MSKYPKVADIFSSDEYPKYIEAIQKGDIPLGEVFPSSLTYYLALQGYYLFSQIKDLSTDDLLKIKGIGLRTINNVVKRIAEVKA